MAEQLVYPFDETPEHGALFPVAPGIHWLRLPLPFALDHINLWLLEDGDGWTLVDTGIGLPEIRALWERILAGPLAGRPIKRVIVTHFHPDHIGCAAWLSQRFGAEVLMTEGEFDTAHWLYAATDSARSEAQHTFFSAHGLDRQTVVELASGGNPYRTRVPELPSRYRRLASGDTLRIGDRSWQVLVGRGHSPEHLALYCAELEVLISGDQLLPRISTNVSVTFMAPQSNPLKEYLASLGALAELPASVLILPAHGRPFQGLNPRIADLEQHHQERLALLVAACDQPKSAAEVLNLLFSRKFGVHELFFAMGEAVAHFHLLVAENKLRRLIDDQGRISFVAPEG